MRLPIAADTLINTPEVDWLPLRWLYLIDFCATFVAGQIAAIVI